MEEQKFDEYLQEFQPVPTSNGDSEYSDESEEDDDSSDGIPDRWK